MPGRHHEEMDVPRFPGDEGVRREVVACGRMRICRLSGEEAEAGQGMRGDHDLRPEELDFHEKR